MASTGSCTFPATGQEQGFRRTKERPRRGETMKLNVTLLAAALALAPLASRADDKKPVTNTDPTTADTPSQRMNRDSTLMKSGDSTMNRGANMDRSKGQMTDQMVLRHLHHANLEEIKAGQMAQSKASSPQVKDYARTLVSDHQQADKQVLAMADKMHVDMKKMDMSDMDHSGMDHSKMDQSADHSKMDHSGMDHSKMDQSADHSKMDHSGMDHSQTAGMDRSNTDSSQMSGMDHDKMKMHQAKMDQLQKMSGKEFDQTFLTMMANGHNHVIDMVKNAQSNASGDLKNMLDQMLPTLERHKQMAQDLQKTVGNTASSQ
jgi:predicted outer membrane protein